MKTEVCAQNFSLTPAIEEHVRSSIALAIGRASGAIHGAVARLRDVNGTRGGTDKVCRIVVSMSGRRTLVVESRDCDLYAAITSAAGKLREAVNRRVRRLRTLGRGQNPRRARRRRRART